LRVPLVILVEKKQNLLHVLELTINMKDKALFLGVLVPLLEYKGRGKGTLLYL
jgi:hypothetical protein